MKCNDVQPRLVDYHDDTLAEGERFRVSDHLETCAECQADYAMISKMERLASAWQDEVPPAWRAPEMPGREPFFASFFQWFPTVASAAALVLVTVMFLQNPAAERELLPSTNVTAASLEPPPYGEARDTLLVQSVMESSRTQRQQELEALVKLLKAEMDRRSLETEESLRYVISHQIQEQQELDQLRETVSRIQQPTPAVREDL